MAIAYLLVVVFFITPIALAITLNILKSHKYIEQDLESFFSPRAKNIEFVLASIISAALYFTITIAPYSYLGGEIYYPIIAAAFLAVTIPSTALSVIVFKATKIYKELSFVINLLIAYLTLWIMWKSGTYANAYVTSETQLSTGELPYATAGVTLILAPMLWGLVMAIIFMALYLLVAVVMAFQGHAIKQNSPTELNSPPNTLFILFLGLGYSSIITINSALEIIKSEKLERLTTSVLIQGGYPLQKNPCSPDATKSEDRFAIIGPNKIAIAKKLDATKYEFSTKYCKPE